MIGVSDAAPPRAVNQPELAVDELSQICEGLARQRPENMPALLNALALIAPLLNAIPNVVFFYQRSPGALFVGEPDAGPPLWFQKRLLAAGQNLRRCLSFRTGSGLYRTGSSGTTGRRDPARSAGNASLQWPRARLVPDAEIGAARYQRPDDRHGRDLARSAGGPRPPSGMAAAGDRRRSYPLPLSPADRHGRVNRLKRDVDCADRTLLQADLSSHPAADDPQSAPGKKPPNCWLAIRRLPISPCSAAIPITALLAASSRR